MVAKSHVCVNIAKRHRPRTLSLRRSTVTVRKSQRSQRLFPATKPSALRLHQHTQPTTPYRPCSCACRILCQTSLCTPRMQMLPTEAQAHAEEPYQRAREARVFPFRTLRHAREHVPRGRPLGKIVQPLLSFHHPHTIPVPPDATQVRSTSLGARVTWVLWRQWSICPRRRRAQLLSQKRAQAEVSPISARHVVSSLQRILSLPVCLASSSPVS